MRSRPRTAWVHRPLLTAGYGAFEAATERSGALDLRLKELAALKAATMVNCEWCMDIGSALARKAGLGDRELRALPEYTDSHDGVRGGAANDAAPCPRRTGKSPTSAAKVVIRAE